MKDNYNFNKMRKIPHPLLSDSDKLTDNVGGISDEEFERKLQGLSPNERDIVIKVRNRRRLSTSVSV